MVELGASDEQLDFPVVYASAVNGYARREPDDGNMGHGAAARHHSG